VRQQSRARPPSLPLSAPIRASQLFAGLTVGLEVCGEGGLWLDRHDLPVVLPNLLEEGCE
jgi:hypothetical protein